MHKFAFSVQKMKSADLSIAQAHNTRSHECASQLPKSAWLSPKGHHQIVSWNDETVALAQSMKVRKDAVVAIEMTFQVGAQGDWRDKPTKEHPHGKPKRPPFKLGDMAKGIYQFLQREFGLENIVSLALHTDESSPHFHAVVIPKVSSEGGARLQAKHWLDGKVRLGALYERAYKEVSTFVPCQYTKGGIGGAKHRPELAAGKSKDAEITALRNRLDDYEQKIFSGEKWRAAIEKIKEEKSNLITRLTQIEAENSDLKSKNGRLTVAHNELQKELSFYIDAAPSMPKLQRIDAIKKADEERKNKILKDNDERIRGLQNQANSRNAANNSFPRKKRRHNPDNGFSGPGGT